MKLIFKPWHIAVSMAITLGLILVLSQFVPSETTLGSDLGLIYVHGTWAWTGKIAFGIGALCGLIALLVRANHWHIWSMTFARTGLSFLLTMLPMSLLIMQRTWGGFYFDEPRWRIPFTFAVTGLLFQLGLLFFENKTLSSGFNLIFGVTMWWVLGGTSNILHPDSAVSTSSSSLIQAFFIIMMFVMVLMLIQTALFWYNLIQNQIGSQVNKHTSPIKTEP